jgi:hypothetical protein
MGHPIPLDQSIARLYTRASCQADLLAATERDRVRGLWGQGVDVGKGGGLVTIEES